MLIVRNEKPEDIAAIHKVNEKAFGQPAEANLVDALRANGKVTLSLVAVQDDRVVGHILFSPVTIESDKESLAAVGLAPMSVLPEFQNQGIGSRLVRAGLDECRKALHDSVVVLGHPEFYPRFGFTPASRYGIKSEYDVRDEVFMIMELRKGALVGRSGTVKYQPEFNEL
ncbi:MAG TPA: N-acetyltransferase [Blastocatellia bacterium]|nr:N-acetyltransferase [Blastocatellia bacterium]